LINKHIIQSAGLGSEREIFVYLPPDYEDGEGLYPVLYMQDGQNIFEPSPAGWGLEETADQLLEDEDIEPFIIVGIANSSWRDSEYTPVHDDEEEVGGWADEYLDFIVDELIPFMDENYSVSKLRENTGIGGSSLGGLLAFYAVMSRPQTFALGAILSPSLWWGERAVLDFAASWDDDPEYFRLWIDMGLWEQDEEEEEAGEPHPILDTDELCEILVEKGFVPGDNLSYVNDENGAHDEASWGSRMAEVLTFLYQD
jgi:predicted alpha/beta superfamily hydrolase